MKHYGLAKRVADLEARPEPVGWRKMLVIISLVLALFAAAFLYSDSQRAGDLQAGCLRTNTTRDALVTVWRKAAASQLDSVRQLPRGSTERRAIERYAHILRHKAWVLVDSVSAFATEPGSARVDCAKAFPSPLGL